MRRNKFLAMLAAVLALLLFIGPMSSVFAASTTKPTNGNEEVAQAIEILGDIKWKDYVGEHSGEKFYSGDDIVVDLSTAVYTGDNPGGYRTEVIEGVECVVTPDSGSVTFKVTVPQSGLYAVSWDYYDVIAKSTNIERTFRINGKVPFNEVRNLLMTKSWSNDYKYDENGNVVFDKDGNGNDRRPSMVQAPSWKHFAVSDPTGYYNGSFYFHFEEGENELTIEAQKEPVAFSNVRVTAYKAQMTYEEYYKYIHENYSPAPADALIYISAETPSRVSDNTLYPINDRSSSITTPT